MEKAIKQTSFLRILSFRILPITLVDNAISLVIILAWNMDNISLMLPNRLTTFAIAIVVRAVTLEGAIKERCKELMP